MAVNRNSDNIRVFGSLDDALWVAPVGTQMPTTLELNLPSPWVPVGWLSDSGVPLEISTDVEKFKAHQGSTTVRTKVTSTEKTISFTMLEKTPLALRLHQGAEAPTTLSPGIAKVVLPEGIGVVSVAAVLVTRDEKVVDFLCMEKIEIGEREEVPNAADEISGYGMSAEVVGGSYLLTNAPAFLEAASSGVGG